MIDYLQRLLICFEAGIFATLRCLSGMVIKEPTAYKLTEDWFVSTLMLRPANEFPSLSQRIRFNGY